MIALLGRDRTSPAYGLVGMVIGTLVTVGCIASPSPIAPPETVPQPFERTVELTVSEVFGPVGAFGGPNNAGCAQITSARSTTISGLVKTTWRADSPATANLRLGTVYYLPKQNPARWVAEREGASPLSLSIENLAIEDDDTFLVYVQLPRGAGVAAAQRVSLEMVLSFVGAELSVRPYSCTFGSSGSDGVETGSMEKAPTETSHAQRRALGS